MRNGESKIRHIPFAIAVMLVFVTAELASAQMINSINVAGRGAYEGTNSNSTGRGVFGRATDGGGSNVGVLGLNDSNSGRGVQGTALSPFGVNYGVSGWSLSNGGLGVYGIASSNNGSTYGVLGLSRSSSGRGVAGAATKTFGVTYGVQGISNSPAGYGVYGWNTSTGWSGFFTGGKFTVLGMLELIPHATSPNIIGGVVNNNVTSGAFGANIGGGGSAALPNKVTDNWGTIGGGLNNQAGDNAGTDADRTHATVGGGDSNIASGLGSTVGGGKKINASGRFATVGGGTSNRASGYISTVSGGWGHTASGSESTVGGGAVNMASGSFSTVDGGLRNIASGKYSTVGGGYKNFAGNNYAVVGGGAFNQAYGIFSTIPGGHGNAAAGYSFAVGRRAKAVHTGAFVWGDSTNTDIQSSNHNQVTFRARGGYLLFTNAAANLGARLNPGATAWVAMSDRASKEKVVKVDARKVLDKLAQMEIATWQYKGVDAPVRHMGPMAQDFYKAYSLGHDEKGISTLDADGVALAAIQGLYDLVKENREVIETKETEIAELKAQLAELKSRLN